MEYVLYYLLGIVIAFILISIGLRACGEFDTDVDTVAPIFIASLVFPITLMIFISIVIYVYVEELFKRILK